MEFTPGQAAGEDFVGYVRRVFEMMAQRREWVFRCRCPMRKGNWAERWISDGCGIDRKHRLLAEPVVVERGNLHKEVVRVLAVDDGLAEGGFALLKELGIISA